MQARKARKRVLQERKSKRRIAKLLQGVSGQ